MPDYSLCADRKCPSRSTCRRYQTKADTVRQSWVAPIRDYGWERCALYELMPTPVPAKETVNAA
jgi:hypothetical protein